MAFDFIMNGSPHGNNGIAEMICADDFNPHHLRPWTGADGRSYITNHVYDKKQKKVVAVPQLISNRPSLLRKDEWMQVDDIVEETARASPRIWGDLASAGLMKVIPNGMGITILQHQTSSYAGAATISMDGLRESERARPKYDIGGIPLPITHEDISFSSREIATSRRLGIGVDLDQVREATLNCIESVERLTLGTSSSYSYGGYTIYGLTNHPNRIAGTVTSPTNSGWTPRRHQDEINAMLQQTVDVNYRGPYGIYYSRSWGQYLNMDYSEAYAGSSLRTRVAQNDNVRFVRTLDFLSGYQVIVVMLDRKVIRGLNGLNLQTVQWMSHGGFQSNLKVFCIYVPQVRADANGNTGLVHAVAA